MQHEQQTDPNAQQAAQNHNVFEQGMETLHSNQNELNRVQIQYSQLEPTPITRQPAVAREPWPGFDTPNTPTCATHVERQNMDVFMAVSCFVCLCCSPLFGGIAYCVASKYRGNSMFNKGGGAGGRKSIRARGKVLATCYLEISRFTGKKHTFSHFT